MDDLSFMAEIRIELKTTKTSEKDSKLKLLSAVSGQCISSRYERSGESAGLS